MQVAHFIQRYPPALGGSEAYFERLSRFLVEQNDQVTVWTTTARDVSSFWSPDAATFLPGDCNDHGVTVRRFPLWRMKGRRWLLKPLSLIPLRTWQALTLPCNPISLAMWRDVKNSATKFDAVHASAFPYAWPIVCAQRLARRWNVPFLLTPFLHLGAPDDPNDRTRQQYTQPALRRLLLSADRVFLQSDAERDAALELGVRPDCAILQGLGVDASECNGGDRKRARHQWGVDADDVVVGHLANLSFEKGTIDLVRAFQQIHVKGGVSNAISPLPLPSREGDPNNSPPLQGGARGGITPNIRLVLAGPAMPNFVAFRQQSKPTRTITELGVLTDQQKRDFFAGIDVFVLPSRSDSFGLVLLEAWANGKPVIAYRAGGPAELIQPGVTGHLVRCGAIDELADRIVELSYDRAMCQKLGRAGQKRIELEFQWADKLRLVRNVMLDASAEMAHHPSNVATQMKTPWSNATPRR